MMQEALRLAADAKMDTAPNPRVGCVIVRDGVVLGRGCTQKVGQAHAEVMALRDAASQGHDVRGATAYVTLEPCSHFGRTPPCANALIESGIGRVVAALEDPNPLVAGRGFAMLREAGIDVSHGLLAEQATELNIGFLHRMRTGQPWVRLKMAASIDGYTALPNGQSQWITDAEARLDGHRWRARANVILTGIGTVLADDPQLTVRLTAQVDGASEVSADSFQPPKWIVDSQLRTPATAQILQAGETCIVHVLDESASYAKGEQYRQANGQVRTLSLSNPNGGGVDLSALLAELARQQVNEVHVEAGAKLSGALMAQGLVNEVVLYLAPKFLGQGRGLFDLPQMEHVDQARNWRMHAVDKIGNGLRLILRP